MTGSRRALYVVALAAAVAGVGCGGGSSTSSSSPTSPSPPSSSTPPQSTTPSSVTVYASSDIWIGTSNTDPTFNDTVFQRGMIAVGWQSNEYGTVGAGAAFRIELPSQITGRTITKATFRLSVYYPPTEVPATPTPAECLRGRMEPQHDHLEHLDCLGVPRHGRSAGPGSNRQRAARLRCHDDCRQLGVRDLEQLWAQAHGGSAGPGNDGTDRHDLVLQS